LLIQSYNLYFY